MKQYDRLRVETLSLFPDVISTARAVGAAEAERRLVVAQDQLEQGKLTVLVCGEFKRGKSSLINALLGDPDLLPVDEHAATSHLTTISYGARTIYKIHIEQADGTDLAHPVAHTAIRYFITHNGNPGNSKRVSMAEVTVDNDLLASGLTFVDSPGIGGAYDAHTATTTEALADAHAIVFVIDAVQPLTESEMRFLKRATEAVQVQHDRDALIVVMTKTDVPGSYMEILADASDKIAHVTGWPIDSVHIIPVSSRVRLTKASSRAHGDQDTSNFAELDRMIWAALYRRQCQVLLGGALGELGRSLIDLLQPIGTIIGPLRQRQDAAWIAIQNELQISLRKLARIAANDSAWRSDLADEVKRFCLDIEASACAEIVKINERVKASYLGSAELMCLPDELERVLIDEMVAVTRNLDCVIERRASKVLGDFTIRNDIALSATAVTPLPDPLPTIRTIDPATGNNPPESILRKLWTNSPRFRCGSTAGVIVGRVVGTVAAPGIGTFVGQAIGGVVGGLVGGIADYRVVRQETLRDREKWLRAMRDRLDEFTGQFQRHVTAGVEAVSASFTHAIMTELDSRIAQRRESAEESVRLAHEARRFSDAEAELQLVNLEFQRQLLEELLRRVYALAAQAKELAAENAIRHADVPVDEDGRR